MSLRTWWQAIADTKTAVRRALMGAAAPEQDPWYDRPTCMKKYRRARAMRNAIARASRRRNRSAQ